LQPSKRICEKFHKVAFQHGDGERIQPRLRLAKRSAIQADSKKTGFFAGLRRWAELDTIPIALNDLSLIPVAQVC
jgi:hypothetical protein